MKNKSTKIEPDELRRAISEKGNMSTLLQFIQIIVDFALDNIVSLAGHYYSYLEGKMVPVEQVVTYLKEYVQRNRSLVMRKTNKTKGKTEAEIIDYLLHVANNYILASTLANNLKDNGVLYLYFTPYRIFYSHFKQIITYKYRHLGIYSPTRSQIQTAMSNVYQKLLNNNPDTNIVAYIDYVASTSAADVVRLEYKLQNVSCSIDSIEQQLPEEGDDHKGNKPSKDTIIDVEAYSPTLFSKTDLDDLLKFASRQSKTIRTALPMIKYLLDQGDFHGSTGSALRHYAVENDMDFSAVYSRFERGMRTLKKYGQYLLKNK